MKLFRACVTTLAAGVLSVAAFAAPPVTAFTNYAQIETLTVSPGGKYLALTHRTADLETLTIFRYPDATVAASTDFGTMIDIDRLEWVTDSRLLVQPARRFLGYRVYEVPTGEIIGVDVDTRTSDLLFGYRAGNEQTGHIIQQRRSTLAWARVIDYVPDDPDSVLIHTGDFDYEGTGNALQRLNIKNGRLGRITGSPVLDASYITDSRHQPLFVTGYNKEGDIETYRFEPSDQSWKLLIKGAESEGQILPFEDTATPGEFIALDSNTPTQSVIAWKPATNERRVLFQRDSSDVYRAGVDSNNHVWVFGYDEHYPEYWYPDPEHPLARAHRALRASFKDANVDFTSQTRDMSLVVARVSAPQIAPVFYLMDTADLELLQELPAYEGLKAEDLSPTDPFEVKVRDGLSIRGYLTTPKGTSGKGLPMIVLPHGGPHGIYDRYDFDAEVQLLASRGYAVLQINFRGSGGRGRQFELSGHGRWGHEMQDDITDGVKWAIDYGVADRDRICIYGSSYGAYAALMGAVREPDLFKCAAGMAGVYDLPLMFEKGDVQSLERNLPYLESALGTDMDDLRQRSPVYNADKINAAVMLIHGKDDERAPYEHALRMRAALQEAGNEPIWISEAGEAHGLGGEQHRAEVYEQMLAFFEKHLGGSEGASAGDL